MPERFVRERSPGKTVFWAIVGVVGIVLTALVYLHPEAVVDMLGGRRRAGAAILGALVAPPALIVLGIVFQFVNVQRYRLRDGGVVRRGDIFVVRGDLDLRPALAAFRVGAEDEAGVRAALASLEASRVDPRVETGQQIVAFPEARQDRTAIVGVLRMDASDKGVLWIDEPPFEVAGDRYFEAASLRPGA